MSITYNDLISRAEQVRDESEIGANTATRVGQLLADIIQWCNDNNADLGDYLLNFTAHLNESGGILNWFQSRIVLLKTMGSAYDDVSVGSLSDGDVYYDSQGNWIREKQGSATINGIHPSKGVFYVNLANQTAYQWDGTTFQVAIESGGGGGASTVTAFEGYEVIESVAELPEQGSPVTGYIVGTHIYAYVGENGDTADGKYQDMGEVVSAIPTIDPATGKWVIGGVLTDRPSRGEKGDNAPVPYIGENGNWYINGNDTGVHAQGDTGNTQILDPTTFDPVTQIVNNLHQGGEGDALSAEMGKRLGDAVFDNAVLNVDYRDVQKSNVYIDGTKWAVDSKSRYQGKFVDVTNYKGWAFKIGGVWIPSGNTGYWWLRFAMVTSKSFSNGGDIPFVNVAPYNAKVENSTSEWHEGVIPSIEGNIYLYIYCYNSTATPVDFPPELYVTDPNPSSRIERLEELTDGVDEIKEGWFAISGEPYSYGIGANNCWPDQGIDPDPPTLGATLVNNSYTHNFRCFPKSASINAAAATPSDCFSVAELPNKTLTLTFAEVEPVGTTYWVFRLALYNASLQCLSVSGWNYIGPTDNYQKVINIGSTSPNAAYFKLVVSRNTAYQNWTYNDGDISFIKQAIAQDSMPDRVAALEEKVAELSGAGVSKFRICSWNVGHWCLGGNYKTDIDTQAKYEEMRGKWRTKLNEMSPDVIVMCEYSTVFAELGTNIEAKDAIFGQYAYRAIGSVPSATSWMQTAQYTNIPIRNTSEVVYAQTVQAGRYYQVSDLVLGGVTAKLVITHLDWGNSQNNGDACRAAQMQTLLDAFANESHVIICGDFNNPLSSEFDVFANAGYSMANHGYMGDLPTYPATKVENGETVPPDKAIDNILVKGFAVSKIEIVDDATLTDHCGIMCDLTLID